MQNPSALIFIDLPSPDPAATATFYSEVFGWETDARPDGVFHRLLPGGHFLNPDGSESEVGNLHIGIYKSDVAPPDPHLPPKNETGPPAGAPVRVYFVIGSQDSQDEVLDRAHARGAEILWRDLYWSEFNGFHGAFRDPWGNEIIVWTKAGADAVVESEQVAWQPAKGYPAAH